jgi:hypothetical protein
LVRLGHSLGQELSVVNHPNRSKKELAVLVTTEHRGVFFGYTTDVTGEVINLRAGRCCVYWSTDLRGFMGLASQGPTQGCRIGPAADLQLRKITSVAEVTPEAVERWEKAPWSI